MLKIIVVPRYIVQSLLTVLFAISVCLCSAQAQTQTTVEPTSQIPTLPPPSPQKVALGQDSLAHSDKPESGAKKGTSSPTLSGTDTVGNIVAARINDPERIEQHEFMISETPRFTMTGSLPFRETDIQTGPIVGFGTGLLALGTAITWYQQAWYPDSTKGTFNFQQDWGYSVQLDKGGHFFGGWMSAYCGHEALIVSGFSQEDAALWGAVGGALFQTFMEVQDGFHRNYGFDWTDEAANVLGAAYFYAQRRIPELQNFDVKWSVGSSGRDSAREASQIRSRLIVDDYDRQNVWVSAKIHALLPNNLQPYWPKWLQLAVGYGAKDVELIGYTAYRTVHVSLDYNLVELLPDMGTFGNWLVQGINNFHLPAPALQVYPDVKFEILFPIAL